MTVVRQHNQRKWAAAILNADLTPIDKVRKLMALGYDDEEADLMVSGVQQSQNQMVYFEQLPSPEYDQTRLY